jgi:hypothetical protein
MQKHSVGDRVVSGLVDAVRSLTHYHRFAQINAGVASCLVFACLSIIVPPRTSTRSSDDDRSGGSEDDADTCVAVPARVSDVDPACDTIAPPARRIKRVRRGRRSSLDAPPPGVCALRVFLVRRATALLCRRGAYPPTLTLVCWLRRRQVRRSG